MSITVIRYSERPELWDDTEALSRAVWPEYNLHGAVLNSYWNRRFDDFPDYQFALFDDEQGEVLAEGHTLPCPWDGTTEGLGDGIDAMTVAAFEAAASGRQADRPVRDGRRGPPSLSRKRPRRPRDGGDVPVGA